MYTSVCLIGKTNRLGEFSEVVILAVHMQLTSRAPKAVWNTLHSPRPIVLKMGDISL